MQSLVEQNPKKNNFDGETFADNLLSALEDSDEIKVAALLKDINDVPFAFKTFATKFDKQTALLKYIFSQKFQRLSAELRSRLYKEYLDSLDYTIRRGKIYPPKKEMITEVYHEILSCKTMSDKKRKRHIDRIISNSYTYCYHVIDEISNLQDFESNTDREFCIKFFDSIRNELITLEFYEHALFFAYLAYRYSKDNAYKSLIEIIIILVKHLGNEKDEHIASYRAFFFQELKTISLPNYQPILDLLRNCTHWLCDREKKALLRLVETLASSDEEKLYYYLTVSRIDPTLTVDLYELIKLSEKIDKITRPEIFDDLKDLASNLRHNFSMDYLILLSIHDTLAQKNNIPTLCHQLTGFESIALYHQNKEKSYQSNIQIIPFIQTLTSACLNKNYEFIDKIINDFLSKLEDGNFPIDHPELGYLDLLVICVFDLVYDYIALKYANDDRITKLLLRSYSVELLKNIKPQDFIKCLEWKGLDKIFTNSIIAHPKFATLFLNLLESLPISSIGKRTALLNNASDKENYPLDYALRLEDDQLALRMYMLGGRKSKAGNSIALLTTALKNGCTQLASYLLNKEKNLRSPNNTELAKILSALGTAFMVDSPNQPESWYLQLNESTNGYLYLEVLAQIKVSARLCITKLPIFHKIEALILFSQIIQEVPDSNPINNVVQAIKLGHILQNCPHVEHWVKNFYQTHDSFLILRQLYKKYPIPGKYLPPFMYTAPKPNPHTTLFRLQHSNLITDLNPHSAWPYNTACMQITINAKGIKQTQLPKRKGDILPSNEVLLSGIKLKLLQPYTYTASYLIHLLQKKQEEVKDNEKLPIDQIYLIFAQYIELSDFDSPSLAYLLLCFPATVLITSSLPDEKYIIIKAFQFIQTAYMGGIEFITRFMLLTEDRRFFNIVHRSNTQHIFLERLPNFLIKILPEYAAVIKQALSPTPIKPVTLIYAKPTEPSQTPEERFENALSDDNLTLYKALVLEFSELFQNNKIAHVLKLCLKENSQILTFLFNQHKVHKIFKEDEITVILKEIIEKDASGKNLTLALNHNIRDPKCTTQTTAPTSDCLYMFALEKDKLKAADLLMPTYLTSLLLKQTAIKGDAALFKRALLLNIRLEGKEDEQVTFHELEKICINDKDKLTAIALGRIITKQQLEDKFGKAPSKRRYKIKTTNPSGEDKFKDFMHQLELLKRYAVIHAESKDLNDDDIKACDLILKKLRKEFNRCGDSNIEKYFADISIWGQIKPSLKNIGQEIQKLEKKELLSKDIIIAQLEVLDALVSKKVPEPQVAPAPTPKNASKGKKKKKSIKKKDDVESPPSATPLVVNKGPSLYGFFEQRKLDLAKAAEQKVDQQEKSPHRLSDSIIAINNDIENTLTEIRNYVSEIPNVRELQMFSEKDCDYLMEQCLKLKQLFWELDDDLSEQSPLSLYKEQLQLLDRSKQDNDTREQLSLFAIQFILSSNSPTKRPSENIEKQKPASATFFQPAILQDDINKFCLKRMEELKNLLKESDIDAIHFCVFRIVNALGEIYRPARMIRHFLIHRFYDIEANDLRKLAELLLAINLAEIKSFVVIERSVLHEQSRDFMLQILNTSKREKVRFSTIFKKISNLVLQSQIESKNEKMLWYTVLIGELAKQTNVCTVLDKPIEMQCKIIRNKVSHENYKESLVKDNSEVLCNVPFSILRPTADALRLIIHKLEGDTQDQVLENRLN